VSPPVLPEDEVGSMLRNVVIFTALRFSRLLVEETLDEVQKKERKKERK
jgi:hypothetical protein